MSLHSSDNVARFKAQQKTKRFGRRGAVLGLALAVVAASGVAWAAMSVFGVGQVKADEYKAKPLTVTQSTFSGPLFPGAELDVSFTVTNPNPFPVKISAVELDGKPHDAVNTTCNYAHLTTKLPISTTAYAIPASEQVVVGKDGASSKVTLSDVVKLNIAAQQGCTLDVKFKVTGVQSGN